MTTLATDGSGGAVWEVFGGAALLEAPLSLKPLFSSSLLSLLCPCLGGCGLSTSFLPLAALLPGPQ